MATDDQLIATGIIAAHCPFGQPEVCSRDWRTYIAMLTALGLSMDEARPDWRAEVKDRLRAFRRAVATALIAAE